MSSLGVTFCPSLAKNMAYTELMGWQLSKENQEIKKIKNDLCKIFCNNDLKITVKANTTVVNFLGVTLDLESGEHYPYTKEGNTPLYVHKKSNHLHVPSILKNIPESINLRLLEISSVRECFDNANGIYQEALNKSSYKYNLTYKVSRNKAPHTQKNRPRNIIWYNLPYSRNVETNIDKCFLSLIALHCPKSRT